MYVMQISTNVPTALRRPKDDDNDDEICKNKSSETKKIFLHNCKISFCRIQKIPILKIEFLQKIQFETWHAESKNRTNKNLLQPLINSLLANAIFVYLFITNSSKWFAIIFLIFRSFWNFINITPHLHKLFQLHLNESGKNQPLKYKQML